MSLTAQKVDAIARILLSEDAMTSLQAKQELRLLMEKPDEALGIAKEVRIHKLMAEIGVPTNTVGHTYLVEAISIVIDDPIAMNGISCSGGLLEQVGSKYNRASTAVERAMRWSINYAWDQGNHEFQSKNFPVVSPITLIPTLTSFISRAANIVRLQMSQQ